MNHSPAPWKYKEHDPGFDDSFHDSDIYDDTGRKIAKVTDFNDAALIAAAPDLLEACKLAYKLVSDLPAWAEGNFEELYYPELVLTLKAAIAKAELIESNS